MQIAAGKCQLQMVGEGGEGDRGEGGEGDRGEGRVLH